MAEGFAAGGSARGASPGVRFAPSAEPLEPPCPATPLAFCQEPFPLWLPCFQS